MRRNYLKGRDGDRINAILAAAGYNFSLLLRWFEELVRVLLLIICRSRSPRLLLGYGVYSLMRPVSVSPRV